MDWKLLLIGFLITGVGGAILWRFRNSRFNKELAPGCAMAGGAVLLLLGVCTTVFGFLFKG